MISASLRINAPIFEHYPLLPICPKFIQIDLTITTLAIEEGLLSIEATR